MDAWEHRQFSVQSPEAYTSNYVGVRSWCDEESSSRWTRPKSLIEHTTDHMRAQYGFPCAHEGGYCKCLGRVYLGRFEGVSTLAALLRYNYSYRDVPWPQIRTCCGSCGGMRDPAPHEKKQCFCSIYSARGLENAGAWMRPVMMRQPSRLQARVCTAPARRGTSGRLEQYWITRVGPIPLEQSLYYDEGISGDIQLSLIPALPKDGTIYITESIDYYYDADKGPVDGTVLYPPIHPHHSTSLAVGHDQRITQWGKGPFENWYPWPAMSSADSTRGRSSAPSMNSPGNNVDLIDCRGRQEVGCFYLKLPPHLGFPVYNGTDLWSGTVINSMANKAGGIPPPRAIYMEYGRKVVLPEAEQYATAAKKMRPVWTFFFTSTGGGETYTNKGTVMGARGSVGWHVFTMPVAVRSIGSWYHTHAQTASELWVLHGDVEQALPHDIVANAKSGAGLSFATWNNKSQLEEILKSSTGFEPHTSYITSSNERRGSYGTWVSPPVLFDFGKDGQVNQYSIAAVQEHLLRSLPPGSLRCQYKSRNELVSDAYFGREAARSKSTASSCDGWQLGVGDQLSLLVFNYPYTGTTPVKVGGGEKMEQHSMWFPVMELLEMPRWWDPEAAGSGSLLSEFSKRAVSRPAEGTLKEHVSVRCASHRRLKPRWPAPVEHLRHVPHALEPSGAFTAVLP